MAWPGVPLALTSAALFGASVPLAHALIGTGLDPGLLAGLLYLGSGAGLALVTAAQRLRRGKTAAREAPITSADVPLLLLVILAGGVIGPVLLVFGLARMQASAASLLLNVEGLATMGIAWFVFRENVDRRIAVGAAALLAGAVILSWHGGGHVDPGALLVLLACVAWAIDNNLTRSLSAADPIQIAMVKGLAAGAVNLSIGLLRGADVPGVFQIGSSALVGFFGYGVSLVCFVLALRHLGTARTAAYFSTSPFVGAVLAVLLLGEPVSFRLMLAGGLMAIGVWLHVTEAHGHEHTHEPLQHTHRHVHDLHHQHEHAPGDPAEEPHTHAHRHAPVTHRHAHYPDLHHRHDHSH